MSKTHEFEAERRAAGAMKARDAAEWAGWTGNRDRVCDLVRSGQAVGISIAGRMGSGKDAVAEALRDRAGGPFSDRTWEVFSISDPLREELGRVLDAARSRTEGRRITATACTEAAVGVLGTGGRAVESLGEYVAEMLRLKQGSSGASRGTAQRSALQILGTEVRRAQDPEWWTRQMVARMLSVLESGRCVIATGLRYRNDVEASLRLGGAAFYVTVDERKRIDRLRLRDGESADRGGQHSSEQPMGYVEGMYVLDNSGELSSTVDNLVGRIAAEGLLV